MNTRRPTVLSPIPPTVISPAERSRRRMRVAVGVLLAAIATAAYAAFPLFQPANGILVGNTSTYVTTAATSSNVRSLWTGTCDATTFLRGDGSCTVPAGTGVTSVGLTMPTGFSVGGSPVTSSGTLAVTTTLSGLLAGNGSGFVTANSGNVTSVFSGTCDASTFLRGDGSCQVAGGGTSGANPTATIGLTAVNGVATTFLRSDGAPALSQAITPTWTGLHTFSLTNGAVAIAPATGEGVLRLSSLAAAADSKHWLLREVDTASGAFRLSTASDAAPTTPVSSALNFTRTGTAVSALNFGNATDNPAFSFLGTGTASFAGGVSLTLTGAPATPNLSITNSRPFVMFNESDQGLNAKNWALQAAGGIFALTVYNDAVSAGSDVITATRSGSGITNLSFGNASDNPSYTFLGTGAVTYKGGATLPRIVSCTLASGSGAASGVNCGTGSKPGTGQYNITFAFTFTTAPTCTATARGTGAAKTAYIPASNPTTTSTAINLQDNSGAAGDNDVHVTCIGT